MFDAGLFQPDSLTAGPSAQFQSGQSTDGAVVDALG
jgi:hypothetical protein